ncbi:MAG: lysophospholipid acyltransferase family protein [Deltaproteobacteria bacterium]|nr:lysophospholipid acyltransferase family protein [Deltaproteobacteria bacterium]MBW2677640.1 lysophospholipid acyltransferase family protein [Deltaproteobacteria bacterium]
MRRLFYWLITFLSRKWGRWIFLLFAWFVATGYFLLFPGRVGNSIKTYRALYPDRQWCFHLWCAWRQFHNFTHVFLDRYQLQNSDEITYISEGMQYLEAAVATGKGAILLMSHMGNWEVAAHLLKQELTNLRLLLYMGSKQKEQIERIQKEALAQSGIRIIAVDKDGGSPMDLVEGIKFIESGGGVSMTGDLVWKREQRTIPVEFLGREILLPEAPHVLALLSGAPLFIFFAFRMAKGRYRFSMSEPIYLEAASRKERMGVIRKSVQNYAHVLEATLRQYPRQWYHFRPFFEPKKKRKKFHLN